MEKPTRIALALALSILLSTGQTVGRRKKPNLNVFIDGKEVARFLFDIDTTLYLVRNSKVAAMLTRPLSHLVPPIDPSIKDIKFKFNSSGKVRYSLSFHSSNTSIMAHPRSSISMTGTVPRKTKAFRIYFPCTGRLSGEVVVHINISFSNRNGRAMVWGPLHIALRRKCRAKYGKATRMPSIPQAYSTTTIPIPQMCNKKCNRSHVLRRFCLSDYAIRAKVESNVRKNGRLHLRVRVTKKYKTGAIRIKKRQLLELRGRELTCSCGDMVPKKVYLIIGKEDRQRRVLFVDNFVTAMEWEKYGKKTARMIKRKRHRCPEKIIAP